MPDEEWALFKSFILAMGAIRTTTGLFLMGFSAPAGGRHGLRQEESGESQHVFTPSQGVPLRSVSDATAMAKDDPECQKEGGLHCGVLPI